MFFIRCAVFILAFSLNLSGSVRLHEGQLDGAPYTVATPDGWSGGPVFFHVNGWRPDAAPHLADLDVSDPFYASILDAGWAVGRTAFKANGVDHPAHTEALFALKTWIEENLGAVETLILEGESTAGTLVLRIAEQHPELADGVIAKGAFFEFEDTSSDSYLEARPRLPSILMSNTSEIEGPITYLARALEAEVVPSIRPLLRPGHVNVNWLERAAALEAMMRWLSEGKAPMVSDGTRQVPERDTGTIRDADFLVNQVTSVDPFFGNAILGFHPNEWRSFGLEQGTSFEIEAHGDRWIVLFGQSYGDVPLGEWVAFPRSDDQILLVRNHESAIETADLKVGDAVIIRKIDG